MGGSNTKNVTKIVALAVALVVVISAFVVLSQNPLMDGRADTGGDVPNTPDTPETPETPSEDPGSNDEPQTPEEIGETTLEVTKTATGFWEKRTVYEWDIEKCLVDECDTIQLEPGECAVVTYWIEAERCVSTCDVYGVRGYITVKNTGCYATDGLAICDTVEICCGCGYTTHVSVEVDVSCKPVLQPGECYSYPYEIVANHGCAMVGYRNVADVTICNYECHAGERYGVQACAEFCIPSCPEKVVVDKTAVLTDYFSIPCGFAAEPLTDCGPWYLGCYENEMAWEFCVSFLLKNVEAPRCSTFCVTNQATLVPEDSQCPLNACADLIVTTGGPETTLCIEKSAEVTFWTEYLRYELNSEDVIMTEFNGDYEEYEPVIVEQDVAENVHTFTVAGGIWLKNTGCYPTEGLTICDTIQMFDGCEWVDVTSICVDTSCKPILYPGEWFCYPYEVTFCVDDLELAGMAAFQFRNVACAEICNYDDDACANYVYDIAPIMLPLRPDEITIETVAECEFCDEMPLGPCAPSLFVQGVFQYNQKIVVKNFDGKSTVDVCTSICLDGKVWVGTCCPCDYEDFSVSIARSQHAEACGDEYVIALGVAAAADDYECLTVCVYGETVEIDIFAFLCYGDAQYLMISDCAFEFMEGKLLVGGVIVDFEIDGDEN